LIDNCPGYRWESESFRDFHTGRKLSLVLRGTYDEGQLCIWRVYQTLKDLHPSKYISGIGNKWHGIEHECNLVPRGISSGKVEGIRGLCRTLEHALFPDVSDYSTAEFPIRMTEQIAVNVLRCTRCPVCPSHVALSNAAPRRGPPSKHRVSHPLASPH
jgi:hypothetical protein